MTIEQRLENLENQNRKLKKFVAGACALALTAIVAGTVGVVKAASPTYDNLHVKGAITVGTSSSSYRVKIGKASDGYGYVAVKTSSGATRVYLSGISGGLIRAGSSSRNAGFKSDRSGEYYLRLCYSDGCRSFYNNAKLR